MSAVIPQEEPITLHYESGEIVQIPWRPDYTISDLWTEIRSHQPESDKENPYFIERVLLYDIHHQRVDFGFDSDLLPTRTLRIILLENDRHIIRIAHHYRYRQQTATWPWRM